MLLLCSRYTALLFHGSTLASSTELSSSPLLELLANYDAFRKYFHNYAYRKYECKAVYRQRALLKHEEVVVVVLIVTAGEPLPVSGKEELSILQFKVIET